MFKPPLEVDNSSMAEDTGKVTTKAQFKKQQGSTTSEVDAKVGGRVQVEESSTSSTSAYNMILLHDLPKEGSEHQMGLWLRKNQKKLKLVDVQEDTKDELDEDYLYKGYAEADLDLDVDSYLEVDKYEEEVLKKQININEGTATTDGDGEEDADSAAVEVSTPVDPVEQQEIHK